MLCVIFQYASIPVRHLNILAQVAAITARSYSSTFSLHLKYGAHVHADVHAVAAGVSLQLQCIRRLHVFNAGTW